MEITMDDLILSLINLDSAPSSGLAEQLRRIFENAKTPVEFGELRKAGSCWRREDNKNLPDVLVLVLPAPIGNAERSFIRTCRADSEQMPIIAVIEAASPGELMDLFNLGVNDFITPPLKAIDLLPRIWRLSEHVRRKRSLVGRLKETLGLRQMIGSSPVFTAELQKIPFVATCDSSVLLTGETGTGKEMFARAIHYLGPRSGKPFMPVNCGAIPVELIENELFGHTRGAFTSAVTSQDGIISEADGGTLFLDEIDCLPLSAQVKLLRFLQEKEYRQLGSAKTRRADVRIVAATNIDLEQAVQKGILRRDLYYRLNIIPMTLPPLRERREDIPVLAKHFMDQYVLEFNKQADEIAPEALQKLLSYDWPGNVRELQNVIERAVVFSSGRILEKGDINLPEIEAASPVESFQEAKAKVIVEFEKNYIHGLLAAHHGNITRAARTAGKNRRAFWELMRKHNIETDTFRSFPDKSG